MLRRGRRFLLLVLILLILYGLSLVPALFAPSGGESPEPLSGRVRTADGEPPPAGTTVEAWAAARLREVSVAPDGTFEFGELPRPASSFVVRTGDRALRFRAGDGPVEVLLPPRGSAAGTGEPRPETIFVSGLLVTAGTDRPVAGAEVSIGESSVRSDGRGRFRLGEIPTPGGSGPHLTVRAEGHRTVFVLGPGDATWDDLYVRMVRR